MPRHQKHKKGCGKLAITESFFAVPFLHSALIAYIAAPEQLYRPIAQDLKWESFYISEVSAYCKSSIPKDLSRPNHPPS